MHEMLAPQPFTYTRDDPIRAIRALLICAPPITLLGRC